MSWFGCSTKRVEAMSARVSLFSLAVVSLLLLPTGPARALSVEDYCRLTAEVMQADVHEATERLGAATSYARNPRAYSAGLQRVETKYQGTREQLYQRYGTTKHEYLTFMQGHQDAVRSHLQTNEALRGQIESLVNERERLRSQLESALVSAGLHRVTPPYWRPTR